MSKTTEKPHKPRRKCRFRLFLFGIALPAIMVVLLCNYTPKAYLPTEPENPDEVSRYLTHELGPDFFNNIQFDRAFDLRVTQDGLNDIIASQLWFEEFEEIAFNDPMIVFGNNSIFLMGTLEYAGASTVLTIAAAPAMDVDGNICINIQSIQLGALPVTSLVGYLAQKIFDQSHECFEGEEDIEVMTQAIIRNEPFEPIFELSGHKARVTKFTLTPGELLLTFQPIP